MNLQRVSHIRQYGVHFQVVVEEFENQSVVAVGMHARRQKTGVPVAHVYLVVKGKYAVHVIQEIIHGVAFRELRHVCMEPCGEECAHSHGVVAYKDEWHNVRSGISRHGVLCARMTRLGRKRHLVYYNTTFIYLNDMKDVSQSPP